MFFKRKTVVNGKKKMFVLDHTSKALKSGIIDDKLSLDSDSIFSFTVLGFVSTLFSFMVSSIVGIFSGSILVLGIVFSSILAVLLILAAIFTIKTIPFGSLEKLINSSSYKRFPNVLFEYEQLKNNDKKELFSHIKAFVESMDEESFEQFVKDSLRYVELQSAGKDLHKARRESEKDGRTKDVERLDEVIEQSKNELKNLKAKMNYYTGLVQETVSCSKIEELVEKYGSNYREYDPQKLNIMAEERIIR